MKIKKISEELYLIDCMSTYRIVVKYYSGHV